MKPKPPAAASLQHRNLPLLLLQAREAVIANFRPILNAHGLTEQQWRIVRALLDAGPLEPRQIVELCRISSPSLAGVLSRMDDLGLVKRERMAGDARRVRVSITPRSRALAAKMAPQIEATYAAIESRIGTEFIGGFYRTLDELITLLGDAPPLPPQRARGWFWGTLAGFTSFISHAGAPPFQVYMLPQQLPKAAFAGTSTIVFAFINAAKIIPYQNLRPYSADVLSHAAALVPFALVGAVVGAVVGTVAGRLPSP